MAVGGSPGFPRPRADGWGSPVFDLGAIPPCRPSGLLRLGDHGRGPFWTDPTDPTGNGPWFASWRLRGQSKNQAGPPEAPSRGMKAQTAPRKAGLKGLENGMTRIKAPGAHRATSPQV